MFNSLGVAIFKVTLRDRAEVFVKKTTIYKNSMTQFIFIFSARIKCGEWKKCGMKKYLLFCVPFATVLY